MTRYAGRHRGVAAPSIPPTPSVPQGPSSLPTVELGSPVTADLPALQSRRSRAARSAGAVVALSLLAVGAVDVVTSRAGGTIGLVGAPLPTLPPQAALEAVAYRADTGDLSTHRGEVRDARAEADAAAARAAADAARSRPRPPPTPRPRPPPTRPPRRRPPTRQRPRLGGRRPRLRPPATRSGSRWSTTPRRTPRAPPAPCWPTSGSPTASSRASARSGPARATGSTPRRTRPPAHTGSRKSLPASKMASAGADYRTNPVDPDHVGPRLHPGPVRQPLRRLGPLAVDRLVLSLASSACAAGPSPRCGPVP